MCVRAGAAVTQQRVAQPLALGEDLGVSDAHAVLRGGEGEPGTNQQSRLRSPACAVPLAQFRLSSPA